MKRIYMRSLPDDDALYVLFELRCLLRKRVQECRALNADPRADLLNDMYGSLGAEEV